MRTTKRLGRLAALAAALTLPATAARAGDGDGPPPAGPHLSSPQSDQPLPMGVSPQAGAANAGAGGATLGPDGLPLSATGDSAGSGAFAGGAGDAEADAGLAANQGGFRGGAGERGAPPGLIGDFPPISQIRVTGSPRPAASSRFPDLPTPTPPNPPGGGNPQGDARGQSILVKLTGLKISDNMSPRPQDRVFYSFNYFDDVNRANNRRFGLPVENLQVYHHLFGLEKTFLDGRASIGFRMPLNTISLKSTANVKGLGGSSTAAGDLSVFLKYALYSNDQGDLISMGLQVTAPTGPGAFGGNKFYSYFRDTQIQPFVGAIFARGRFYAQGFSSINVPTMSQDVTLLFNDLGIGYYAYRSDEDKLVTAIVPTAEAHLTTPLNHRGLSATDIAAIPDILNMTAGVNLELHRRAILTAAYITPVTGPKPFNAEFALLLNVKFGRSARSPLPGFPSQ